MFLLTERPGSASTVLDVMIRLLPVPPSEIHSVELGSHTLLWSRAQVRDNLHVHTDGLLIGRHSASEALSDAPIHWTTPLPDRFDPLLLGVVVRTSPTLTVEPLGVTNVYRSAKSVSDRQLLLAAEAGLQPSPEGVSVLAGIGYFPGNMTLFSEVKRVSFLHRWDAVKMTEVPTRRLECQVPDDNAMIERLVALVPTDVGHALGLSGGYDSRFALGLLHRAGADVRIVRFTDGETEVVEGIARSLGLEVIGAGSFEEAPGARSAMEFTLLSDAQIWHGVSQHGRLGPYLRTTDLYHTGHFADPMTKNTFKTAWKRPDPRSGYWNRLIAEVFLGNVPAVQPGLRSAAHREDVEATVRSAVAYQRDYLEFPKRKQWANWLHYMNRGMRWTQAFHDDVAFSTNLVFLLADIDAQLLGISTGFWENFHNDRASDLNHRLLPQVTTGYVNGRGVETDQGLRRAVGKLEYEYLTRLRVRRKARAYIQSISTTWEDDLPPHQPPGWDQFFDRPLGEDQSAGGYGLRRAKVTVANVLTFLAAARP